jgi:hypothetical protein
MAIALGVARGPLLQPVMKLLAEAFKAAKLERMQTRKGS